MKILLTTLNAKHIHSNLALKYLYTSLVDSGFPRESLTLSEFTINQEEDYIFGEIVGGEYDIICASCYIWNIDKILRICENVKKASPGTRIILGGPEVSFDTELLLAANPFIEAVASGVLTNSPFPYKYLDPEPDKIIYYESMRGCPFACSYCLSSIDKAIECLPLDRVFAELSFFLERKVKQVKFIDRTFNFDRERAGKMIDFLKENDNGITNFHFEMCAEIMTGSMIEKLSSARKGLFQLEIGIQSTNKLTLAACQRNADFAAARKNILLLMQAQNIHMHLDLIAGLPIETYESFQVSFNDVYKLKPHHLQLGFLKLLKGSLIREQCREHEYQFQSRAPYEVISNAYITAKELLALKKTEKVLDLFYNRGGFAKTLLFCIEGLSEPPFHFFQELADYFYENGYHHQPLKKEELYRIFHQFIGQRDEYESEGLQRIWQGKDIKKEIHHLVFIDMTETLNEDAVKRLLRKYPFLEAHSV